MKQMLVVLAVSTGVLMGWQSGLMPLGVTEQQVRDLAMNRLMKSIGNPPKLEHLAYASASVRKAFLALAPDQRTFAAEAVAGVVKPLLLSPETRSAWNQQLAKQGGIDHGIQPQKGSASQTDINQILDQTKKQILQSRMRDAQEFAKNPQQLTPQVLTIFIDTEISLLDDPESMMAVSPAAQKSALVKLQEARKLVASNPAAAQKALADGRFLAVGVQPDQAGLANAARQVAKNEQDAKRAREQEMYDRNQYAATVRAQLQQLISTAATVDFQAATVKKGASIVFVNPAYEAKPSGWKMLYRAGKGPVQVAVAAAKQVLAAL